MMCPYCESTAITERPKRTELGYRRFRCRNRSCGRNPLIFEVLNEPKFRNFWDFVSL